MGITVVGTVNAIEAELQNELNPIYLLLKGNPTLWKKKCAQTKILMITVVTLWSVKSYVALNYAVKCLIYFLIYVPKYIILDKYLKINGSRVHLSGPVRVLGIRNYLGRGHAHL